MEKKQSIEILDLNNPKRFDDIRAIINKKMSLRLLYLEIYQKYLQCINQSPEGKVLEIGSGAGFVKDIIPQIITSDIIPYAGIDRVIDATHLDFPDQSLACICMFNVLHHISDSPAFFREAARCLVPNGRIFMVEPYAGWVSSLIYRYLHHEDFDLTVDAWEFESNGPVSDANNALPTIIFERDLKKFQQQFPHLELLRYQPHTPWRYWLTGGLKNWSLLPKWAFKFASWADKKFIQISPKLGSFVDIEIRKI
jgi:SAM-dependent methyltransferase